MHQGELRMTGTGTAVVNPTALLAADAADAKPETVETRFGKVTISRANPIMFPSGLLGMPDKLSYALAKFPSAKFDRFKLLQSLDDDTLGFITLPLDVQNGIIARDDLLQAASDLSIPEQHLGVLLIVSVHRETSGVRLSVNARAPVLMHAEKRTAYQYVFASNKYNIRHPIAL